MAHQPQALEIMHDGGAVIESFFAERKISAEDLRRGIEYIDAYANKHPFLYGGHVTKEEIINHFISHLGKFCHIFLIFVDFKNPH